MDTMHMTKSEVEKTIRDLERRSDEIEHILERRDQYLDMIDWSAMTELDRDWAQHHLPDDLRVELWEIDAHLDHLIRSRWTGWED
nr:hypothetical protein [Sphingomonas sp. CDS-1]